MLERVGLQDETVFDTNLRTAIIVKRCFFIEMTVVRCDDGKRTQNDSGSFNEMK